MHLWVDGQCLQTASRFGDVGRYLMGLLPALRERRADLRISISFNAALETEAVEARRLVAAWIDAGDIHLWQGIAEEGESRATVTARRRFSEALLAHHVATLGPDVALSAGPFEGANDVAVPLLDRFRHDYPIAAIFHDAMRLRFPNARMRTSFEQRYYARRLERLRSFERLFAISRSAGIEAKRLVGASKVSIVGAGASADVTRFIDDAIDPTVLVRYEIGQRYLLYVGSLDPHDNVPRVSQAIASMDRRVRDCLTFVVVTGDPDGSRAALRNDWAERGLNEASLRIVGPLPDGHLVQLYRQALVVVQPALMGVGLTALDAMASGAAVIGSNTGALAEVIADEEALFDPYDVTSIASRLERAMLDDAELERLRALGRAQASRRTWVMSAERTIQALHEIVERRVVSTRSQRTVRETTLASLPSVDCDESACAALLAGAELGITPSRRLLIDVTATCHVDHATGIQRVVKKVSAQLKRVAGTAVELVHCDDEDGFFQARWTAERRLSFAGKDDAVREYPTHGDILLMLDSSWMFHEAHAEVLGRVRLRGSYVVSTLYDMVPLKLPAFCDAGVPPMFARWFAMALERSDAFVCISRSVAEELMATLRAAAWDRPLSIGYWHLGADFEDEERTAIVEDPSTTPVYLIVGTLEPRKGHAVALDAFEMLWASGSDAHLTIVGRAGWGVDLLIDRVRSHDELGRRLEWIEGLSDEGLASRYRACRALVAPSYGEGFGLPIVEAAVYGKPVIASDIAVFREVGGENTLFFDVGSARALALAVESLESSIEAGPSFEVTPTWLSWSRSAGELHDMVIGRRWQMEYRPRDVAAGSLRLPFDHLAMTRLLQPDEQLCALHVVGTPQFDSKRRSFRVVVKVDNESLCSWSSHGGEDGRLGIFLGFRAMDRDGRPLSIETERTSIPFLIGPGDSCYLAIEVAPAVIAAGTDAVDIRLLQEGVGWWSTVLRVPLPTPSPEP